MELCGILNTFFYFYPNPEMFILGLFWYGLVLFAWICFLTNLSQTVEKYSTREEYIDTVFYKYKAATGLQF